MNVTYGRLVIGALWGLARYDLVNAVFGFRKIYTQMLRQRVRSRQYTPQQVNLVCNAVSLAACFYWKPALCLQRSLVTARILRKCGIPARLVIAYRPSPFFSHAWVEVENEVVNDSPAYKERLIVLCTA